ncbi:MAG: hypothetical protein F3745_00725 [Nitrospinae bacterium]|nr:hypothetical protein [Nitrospinota bacterium]
MKWWNGILIVAVITAPLAFGKIMNHKEQELEYKKGVSTSTYEGTINGKHFFKMALTREGNTLNGTLVNTLKKENQVFGFIDGDDSFVLTEYEEGKTVGVLEGKLIMGGDLRGTWSTPEGNKWFPFYLIKETG